MKASFEDTIEHKEERDHESTFAPIAAGGDLCCRRDGSKDRRQQQWVRMSIHGLSPPCVRLCPQKTPSLLVATLLLTQQPPDRSEERRVGKECSRHEAREYSSRRRHTRSLCDWSSDVCSSDLIRTHCCWRRSLLPSRRQQRSPPAAMGANVDSWSLSSLCSIVSSKDAFIARCDSAAHAATAR